MPCLVIIAGRSLPPNTWFSSQPGLGDPSFKPTPMPTARAYLAAAPLGTGLAGVFGGHNGSSFLSTNEVYDYSTNTWTSRASMPTARAYLAAAPLGTGKAGVFGGYNSGYLTTNQVYDYSTNTWASKAPMPTARNYLAAASLGDGLAGVFGGYNGSSYLSTNEVYSY